MDCLAPVVGPKPHALILGSFPGKESLKRRQYFGNPRNQFWRIMGDLFGAAPDADYAYRTRILTKNRICLWDVVASCSREGSADATIRNARFNDIVQFLSQRPTIRVVFFDGKSAERLFLKNLRKGKLPVPCFTLPSTSPAYAAMPYEEKLKRWSTIKGWL